jgi:thymidylate synthase
MNNIDKQYLDLVRDILENGTKKETRNGGTLSVFGRQIRHKMSEGFPLLTTKKMHWKSIVTELLWFLRGDTHIKFLHDNGCHIWDGDVYKNYLNKAKNYTTEDLFYNKLSGVGDVIEGMLSKHTRDFIPYTQEEFINKIKTDNEFAKKWGELGPIYGKQWRDWETFTYDDYTNRPRWVKNVPIDQITNLINDLKTNPDSRRLMVSSWNVGELDKMILPACHYGFQVYTKELSLEERIKILEEKSPMYFIEQQLGGEDILTRNNIPTRAISLMWNQRSVDTGLGLPFNIASYALLLEILGKLTNMVPDELIGNLGDTHLYLNHVEPIKEQLTREPYELPRLSINTEFWLIKSGECGVGDLSDNVDSLIKGMQIDDFYFENYKSHPIIKLPLSN